MEMEELLGEYKNLNKQMDALKKEMNKKAKMYFTEKFKEIFDKYPGLEKVRWSAYTPYFNDGEPCTFNSNHEYADIIGDGENENYEYDSPEGKKASTDIRRFLKKFDDEMMRAFFGEEVEVSVTKKGVSVGDCGSHD